MTKETDLAWAAGFIDGEGCISIPTRIRDRNRRDYNLSLYVGQVDPRPLRILQAMFGGSVVLRKTSDLARRPMFMWRITGNLAEAAIVAMLPYLVVKREQAEVAVEFREGVRSYVRVGRRVSDQETDRRAALLRRLSDAKWRSHVEGGDAERA